MIDSMVKVVCVRDKILRSGRTFIKDQEYMLTHGEADILASRGIVRIMGSELGDGQPTVEHAAREVPARTQVVHPGGRRGRRIVR